MGGKGAVRRAWTFSVVAANGEVHRVVCTAQLCEKKKRRGGQGGGGCEGRRRRRGQGKACQLRQGPATDQGCSISSLGRGAEKDTIQKHLES